jgi:hypothetical protein
MDKFRTPVIISDPQVRINYQNKSLLMGSCFADTIGAFMNSYKFPVLINPFGTLFNPFSIAENLTRLVSREKFTINDLKYHNGVWFSFSHYTGFAHANRDVCLSTIHSSMIAAADWLKQCDFLMITFGTAVMYRYKDTHKIVANCHKLPAAEFTRELASPDAIIVLYEHLLEKLRQINPQLRVIFTLSPVRHWSDGAITNQLSKSVLHYSIQQLLLKQNNASYFPAYEIFMDELRDYRFYAPDMLHPSESGSNYVWERFYETYADDSAKEIMAGVAAILKAAAHRPMNTESTNHKTFVQKTLKQIQHLTESYPFLDFSNEIAKLQL